MKCLNCTAELPGGSRFCPQCGQPITRICAACGHSNQPGTQSCIQCGAKLAVPEIDAPTEISAAERRQVTVLFCDLVGSTALSARLDPEDLRTAMADYHRCCTKIIKDHGGFVARYMGDGVMAYFGYPRAQEDDAEQAVRAGLALTEGVARLRAPNGETLSARVGIATGLVVVGDLIGEGPSEERGVVGQTPNVAARLQNLAEPGSVVIGPSTRRLLGGLFEYGELGPVSLKGFAQPVAPVLVLRPSAVESRFEARQEHGMAALVGREQELELLERHWRRARAGQGQAVTLSGEAGIGKSRLARALQDRLATEPHIRLRYSSSPHHRDSTLHPIIGQLEHAAGFHRDDTGEIKLVKLEKLLLASGATAEAIGLIAQLLSVPVPERYRLPEMSLERRKERTFEALMAQVVNLSRQQPLLMVYEDAHWSDPASLELIAATVTRLRDLPILMIVTTRPEFTPAWSGQPHATALALTRLDRDSSAVLVDNLSQGAALPREVMDEILERTDGVPLFLEELTKAVLEGGALAGGDGGGGGSLKQPIPTTLHDSLMARIDRLPSAREVAQAGAALGRDFAHDILRAASGLPDDRLRDALNDLVRSGLLLARGNPPDLVYSFKHALVQDAAYESMLKSRRVQLHAGIATVLEREFPNVAESEPETLARHFSAAALPEPAIRHWLAAARRARQRGAPREAISHLQAGMALLASVPDPAARIQLEIGMQAELGYALITTKGYFAEEVGAAFSRAGELCRSSGRETPIPVLRGVALFHWVRGDFAVAKALAQELIEIAERKSDAELLLVAQGMMGSILLFMGELASSDEHFKNLAVPYDHQARRNIVLRFGEDTPSTTGAYHGFTLALLGYPDRAWNAVQEALDSAHRTGHPYSVVNTTGRGAACAVMLRDPSRASTLAEKTLAMAEDLGFSLQVAFAKATAGWASAMAGKTDEGLRQIREGLEFFGAFHTGAFGPFLFGVQSDAELAAGNVEAALAAADEGLRRRARTGESAWDALLYCSRGDALRLAGRSSDAEAAFQAALRWSRERNAKLGELYAGVRLARLRAERGRPDEGRALLGPILSWFTEGFDMPVIKEARKVLDESARWAERH